MNLHNLKNLVIIGSTNGGLPTRNLVADVWVYPIETKEVPPLSGKSIFYQDPIGSSRSMGNAGSSITYKKFGFSLIRSIGTGISFSAMRLTYGVLIQLTKEKKNSAVVSLTADSLWENSEEAIKSIVLGVKAMNKELIPQPKTVETIYLVVPEQYKERLENEIIRATE